MLEGNVLVGGFDVLEELIASLLLHALDGEGHGESVDDQHEGNGADKSEDRGWVGSVETFKS